MAYAILRTEKLKSFDKLGRVGGHHFRTNKVMNADVSRSPKNIEFIKRDERLLEDLVKERIGDKTIRKNGVLAIEVLMTASPEFFRDNPDDYGVYDQEKTDQLNKLSMDFLKSEFGEQNIMSAVCHLDEATPHIQAIIVPMDPETGRLNASYWLDGKRKLSEMQDRYFEYVKDLGLERGLKGSQASHTTIKQFYGALESADILTIPKALISTPPMALKESKRESWAEDESERIDRYQAPTLQPIIEKASTSAIASKKKKEADKTAKKYAEELDLLKKEAALVRDIDLVRILKKWGAKEIGNYWGINPYLDPDGKEVYEHIILKNGTFLNEQKSIKGRNAIDLVMHLENVNFKGAVSWLGNEINKDAAVGAAMKHAKEEALKAIEEPTPMPLANEQHWPHVREYLINYFGLKEKIIDFLHKKNRLFADTNKNACFSYGKLGVEKVATRGVSWSGFTGSEKEGFNLKVSKKPSGVIFVESAIDALSFDQLRQSDPKYSEFNDFDIIAVGGLNRQVTFNLSKNYEQVIIAFNNDKNAKSEDSFEDIQRHARSKTLERLSPAPEIDWTAYINRPEPMIISKIEDINADSLAESDNKRML